MSDLTKPDLVANAIMGRLYDILTNGDATMQKSKDNVFNWCCPGIPVSFEDLRFLSQGLTGVVMPRAAAVVEKASSPGGEGAGGGLTPEQLSQLRAQDTNAVYQQAEMLARMLDFVPELNKTTNGQFSTFSISNNEGSLSQRYKFILKMSQTMDQELDQATQDKIAKFRGLLQTTAKKTDLVTGEVTEVSVPSLLVQAYHTKMAAYDAAALTYNAARISALTANDPGAVQNWAINANILRNEVTAAMDDWITNGYKDSFEEIAAYINQVSQRDMKLLKEGYEQDLRNATLTGISSGSDFLYTALAPADFANNAAGWSDFTFSKGDFHKYSNFSLNANGWSANASAGFMGLGAHGGASESHSQSAFTSGFELDSFSLRFKVCQVPILRPWFNDAFLISKSWRFDQTSPDSKGRMLSNGGSPPAGLLPAYPTMAVFVRDLVLTIRKDSDAGRYIQQMSSSSQDGGGCVALGPFSFGGSASHYSLDGYSNQDLNSHWDDQGLTVPGMQIAGFKCHVITAKAPDPDPSIKKWA